MQTFFLRFRLWTFALAMSIVLASGNAVSSTCQDIFVDFSGRASVDREGDRGAQIANLSTQVPIFVTDGVPQIWHQLAFSGAFIGQHDPRLKKRGLLRDGGGLCGPTLGVMSLYALFRYVGLPTREFEERPDHHIDHMIMNAWNIFFEDARMKMTLEQLARAMELTMREITGHREDLGVRWWDVGQGRYSLDERNFVTPKNRLTLALVTVGNASHYVVVVGIDRKSRRITYAEPNNPGILFTTVYVPSSWYGASTINFAWNGQFPGVENGYVVGLMEVWLNESILSRNLK